MPAVPGAEGHLNFYHLGGCERLEASYKGEGNFWTKLMRRDEAEVLARRVHRSHAWHVSFMGHHLGDGTWSSSVVEPYSPSHAVRCHLAFTPYPAETESFLDELLATPCSRAGTRG